MVDRINLILKAKNLTSRQFAEEIGIQPSGMSHILSGRNRPSLDFVMKVVNRYPEIDIKWLTLGEGEMYVSPYSLPVAASKTVHPESKPEPAPDAQPDLFSSTEPIYEPDQSSPAATSAAKTTPASAAAMTPATAAAEEKHESNIKPYPTSSPVVDRAGEPSEPPQARPVQQPQEEPSPRTSAAAASEPAHQSDEASRILPASQPAAMPVNDDKNTPDDNVINRLATSTAPENRIPAKKKIEKVVILYDDHTFSEYFPE